MKNTKESKEKKLSSKDIENNITCCNVVTETGLPEINEIIITADGLFIIDINGPLKKLEIKANQIGNTILCG